MKDINDIPRSVCNIKQSNQALQRHNIFLNESYQGYILEEIKHRENIEYRINIWYDGDD